MTKPPEIIITGFEAKPVKTATHKPSTLVLRLNQETCAPHLHVHSADHTRRHLISRSPGHQVPDLCDHPRSSAPGLILLPRFLSLHAMPHLPPAHHETSKRDSPSETKIKEKQNKTILNSNSSLVKSMTHHNQTKKLTTWFLTVYLLLYVDDIILNAFSTELLRHTIYAFQRKFAMKDLRPLHHFISITVERRLDGLFLHQHTYTFDILKRAVMPDCKPCMTPVNLQVKLAGDSGPPIEDVF
jgi:hypothetical protein